MMFVCFIGQFDNLSYEKASTYLKSYYGVYPIDKEIFIRSLDAFTIKQVHSAWVESEYYIKNKEKTGVFLSQQLTRNRYFKDHYEEFKNKVITLIP